MFIIPYEDANLVTLNLATENAANSTKEDLARRAVLTAIIEIALNNESNLYENIFRFVISRFINKQISAKKAVKFNFIAGIKCIDN